MHTHGGSPTRWRNPRRSRCRRARRIALDGTLHPYFGRAGDTHDSGCAQRRIRTAHLSRDRGHLQPYPGLCETIPEAHVSKADDVFWRQFGVILILLTVFGFAMYFVANSIGGNAYAKMRSNPDGRGRADRTGRKGAHRRPPRRRRRRPNRPHPPRARPRHRRPRTASAAPAASDSGESGATAQTVATAGGRRRSGGGREDLPERLLRVPSERCGPAHRSSTTRPRGNRGSARERRGLLQSVTNGKGAMPPKGGFAHLTEDEIRNAIEFMLDKAGIVGRRITPGRRRPRG